MRIMSEQEGVIKFRLDFERRPLAIAASLTRLTAWRDLLHRWGLIGADARRYGGLAYGNLSMRLPPWEPPPEHPRFVITGSQTSAQPKVDHRHFAVVTECDPERNRVGAYGPVQPSSEALTHGVLYALDPALRYVFHVHSPEIWRNAAAGEMAATSAAVPYGTPAMATEVRRLFSETDVGERHLFAMLGHEDGVVAFGQTAEEAGRAIERALRWALGSERSTGAKAPFLRDSADVPE